jgi:threonine dehydrogenase-like Zn-dependent dehydrogenase
VIFECVGVPGVIQQVLAGAPVGARIVVAGLCLQTDAFEPAFGLLKEVDVRFALMWSVREFARTLRHLAEGDLVADAIVTGKIGLAGVAEAFAGLASPERHAKVLIDPSLG